MTLNKDIDGANLYPYFYAFMKLTHFLFPNFQQLLLSK
ncbi:Uncharacterised protein [Clostridioides difficile]|uniref:Uncharacterized protein n=1 Tax=Clostridioides difficile TaxID=1496 RepID=A0AAX3GVQ4_CLODI|nr:hypothetical protein CDIF29020_01851 [Clostridioides difficile]SHO36709.1 hypothetical protein CDIFFM120_01917C [Clostridioides difficile M120]AXU90323.1 hypothetical protein CDIF29747_01807 [Clostridioides difficile]OMK40403.1 hypothetical protein BER34_002042 [Clostridioides difficile]OMK64995.1 hypothetical protein BER35_001876 [Clostridioides difficile]